MSTLIIEKAKLKNLKDLIYLLFEDDLGKERENLRNISINKYKKAFTKIIKDSNNEIFIMILNDQIIGMMQLTFIPGLSMQGITRCQTESVRIKKEYRKENQTKIIKYIDLEKYHSKNKPTEENKKELYEKLLAKNYDSTNIELVLIDFEKNGWINDEEFGLAFSKDQINQNSLGPIALKYKLKKYISSDDIISNILHSIYSEIEIKSIIFKVLKKYTPDEVREDHILREKIVNKLKRKGHYWQDINDSVNKYIEGSF